MLKEINIFGYKISSFALCIAVGFLFAILVLLLEIKKEKLDKNRWEKFFCLIPIIVVGGFLGAIIFDKIAHFKEVGLFELAGMSFAGGIIGGVISLILFYPLIVCKDKKIMFSDIGQLICPLLIAHAFGRIGCFMGGCCYGIPSNSFLAVTFPEGSLQHIQYGHVTKVLPTQLFEALFLFILFMVLLFFFKKSRIQIYLISYGVFRFLIEFIRGDNRGAKMLSLSPSQWTSILFIIFGVLIIILGKYHKKKVVNSV